MFARRVSLVAALAVTLASAVLADYREGTAGAGGRIRGVVRLAGTAPKVPAMATGKDEAVCGKEQPTPRLIVGSGAGVANAVVYLDTVASGKPFARREAVLDQKGCRYEPHVVVVPRSPALAITNSDTVLHNVHACTGDAVRKTIFNIAQPLMGQKTPISPEKLATPGIYALSCEAGHPWMSGYLVVAAHPYYAVTSADGRFALDDVPAGKYTLRMWHEGVHVRRYTPSLQRYEFEEPYEAARSLDVKAPGETDADFVLQLRPAPRAEPSR